MSETPETDDSWARSLIGADAVNARALSPGVGAPGFGTPFALGAKLARPGGSVALATTRAHLMAHIDSLLLARSAGIKTRIVAAPGADAAALTSVARIADVELVVPPRSKTLGPLCDELTIVVQDNERTRT